MANEATKTKAVKPGLGRGAKNNSRTKPSAKRRAAKRAGLKKEEKL